MTTFHKTLLTLVAIGLLIALYTLNIRNSSAPTIENQPIATSTTPNGICGLFVTSHNINGKASLQKPITVSGIVDNTDHQTRGCAWQMFEGQAGTAQAFAYVDNQWKSISKQTFVPVANWMTNKTTFKVELAVNTGVMNIAAGTPVKVVFTEENASGEPPVDTYTLPLTATYGELDQPESMPLTVRIQDKAALAADRCDATVKATFQVPKTTAVADASLKLLFSEELAYYGVYKSVGITNGIAKVTLAANTLPDGRQYSSLSSCESGHLTAVLRDTLTQYNTITSVELYRPAGKIVF